MASRVFEDHEAVRSATGLLVGLVGPSGTGKTFSALRLATGIQRVTGGDIHMIDTEAKRGLHYADRFKFRHVPFVAPFGPLDYLAAIEHCAGKGAKVIIVDSMSHEHEGPGGVLEMHAAETERIAKAWRVPESKAQMSAWNKPKSERRRMINTILQIPVHFIFCFRAKEKLEIVPGKDPLKLGFMPLAGEEFVYEMAVRCLLHPGANGVPTWQTDMKGEREIVKTAEQFRDVLASPNESYQLSEDIGEKLAKWAAGTEAKPVAVAPPLSETARNIITAFGDLKPGATDTWQVIREESKGYDLTDAEKAAIKRAALASAACPPRDQL